MAQVVACQNACTPMRIEPALRSSHTREPFDEISIVNRYLIVGRVFFGKSRQGKCARHAETSDYTCQQFEKSPAVDFALPLVRVIHFRVPPS